MNGAPRMASSVSRPRVLAGRAAGDQQQRIEVALHGDAARRRARASRRAVRRVAAEPIHARRLQVARRIGTRPARKADDRHVRVPPFQLCHDSRVGATTQRSNSALGQRCRPSVSKICSASAPAAPGRRGRRSRPRPAMSISLRKTVGVAVGPQPRVGLIGGAAAGDHVGRNRPRRAAKSDQRRPRRKSSRARAQPSRRRGRTCRRCARGRGARGQLAHVRSARARAFALGEGHALAERIGHDEDVGEQDRRVEAEAADRLQRHLGCELGRVARGRGSRRPSRAPRGTRAGSGRPGASARWAAG